MQRPAIRILDLAGTPEAMGFAHGHSYAEEIRQYTAERVELVAQGLWSGGPMKPSDVIDVAESMLSAHERHSPRLYTEMVTMADAAGISAAEAVVVGGFTDFVDTVRAVVGGGGAHPETVIADDCTAAIVPDHRASGSGYMAQTWDMHASATDHVILLRIRPDDLPAALVFTTAGALGQIGMNELGVCVGINNLTATDGTSGVVWTQVVRDALEQSSADAARDAILDADLAGGHNFLVFDADGVGYNIEAMPSARPVTSVAEDAVAHTNHTLTDSASALQGPRPSALDENSKRRLSTAQRQLDRDGVTEQDLMALTRDSAVCQVATDPYHVESSGAVVMRPKTKDFWAVWGLPSMNEFQHVEFPL